MEKVLWTTDLEIGYRGKEVRSVAKQLQLQLHSGQLTSLVGGNGAGKSTLLKTLTGVIKPLHGKVLLNGVDVHQAGAEALSKEISLVLTEKLPPSNLSVYELVALGRQPYTNWLGQLTTLDHEKVRQALQLTQVFELAEKKHYEISDGQLQRVLIARALAQDTPLIILDEPTTHLDLLHKVAVFKLLKKLTAETQKCILFSTHDIDLAIQLSDEMLVLNKGQLEQDQPCNLIQNGAFKRLFEDEHIRFDERNGRFIID